MKNNKAFPLRFLPLVVAALCAGAAQAQLAPGALPTGATLVGGQATIVQNGTTLNIQQTTNQALVNFSGFNVGSAALVDIRQPGAAAALLARVTGGDPSQIYGRITANGALWLVNPAGIMVGQGARIDVGSFIASTLQVSDDDFLAGRLTFTSPGNAGVVRNEGAISAAGGGHIYLVGRTVENTGSLEAPQGEVLLAAGQNVQLVDTGNPGVSIALSGAGGSVSNLGRIVAEAGRIGLGGALVSNAGEISASSAVSEGGRIFLRATELKTTAASDIQANGVSGGNVELVADTADIGGLVSATGSAGPGGTVETSGHVTLGVQRAPTVGRAGRWVIGSGELEVVEALGATAETGVITSGANAAQIAAAAIAVQLDAGVGVWLQAGGGGQGAGNITVDGTIVKNAGEDGVLTLRARNDIALNASIASTAGALTLNLNSNAQGERDAAGHAAVVNADLNLNGGAINVSTGAEAFGNGTLNIAGGTTALHGASQIQAAAVNVQMDARVTIDGAQSLQGAWTNAGEIELQGDGALDLANPDASLVNQGRVTLSGRRFDVLTGASDVANLSNHGEIVKTSADAQDIARLDNGPTGRIVIDAGRLSLSRSTVGGSVTVAEGAELLVKGTEQGVNGSKLGAGVNITGAGAMSWRGNVEMLGDVTLGADAPTLDIASGPPTFIGGGEDTNFTFTTRGRIDIQGEFVLGGGTVWDNHGTVNVGTVQSGVLSFNSNTVFNNKAGALVDVSYGSRLYPSNLTTINNEADALMQIASNGSGTFSGGYQGLLVNSGTIVKTGLPTMTAPIENRAGGVLDIREGGVSVSFSESNANAGTVLIATGAALRSTGGVDLHNIGTIRGTGTVDLGSEGGQLVNNGVVAPGGSDEVGTLTINGGFTQGPQGALDIRLSGNSSDRLDVTGPVQLGGTLNLSTLGGGMPDDGVVADFLTGGGARSTGSFAMVNAPEIVGPETTGTLSVVYPEESTALAQVKATTAPTVVVVPPVEPPVVEPPVVVPPVVEPPVVEPPVVVPPVVEPPVTVPPVVEPPVVTPPVIEPPVVVPPVVVPPVVEPPVVVPPIVEPPIVTPPVVEPPVVVPPVVVPPVVEPPVVEPPIVVPPVVVPPVIVPPVVVPPVVEPPVVVPPVVEPPVVVPPVVVPPVVEPPVVVPPVVVPPIVEPPVVVPPVVIPPVIVPPVVVPPVVVPPVVEPPVVVPPVVVPPIVEPPVVVPPVIVPPVVVPPVIEPPVVVPPVVVPPVVEPPIVVPPVVVPPIVEPPVVVPPVIVPPVVVPPVIDPPIVVPPVVVPPVVVPPVVEPPVVIPPVVVPPVVVPPVVEPPIVVPPFVEPPVVVPPVVVPPIVEPPVVVPPVIIPPVVVPPVVEPPVVEPPIVVPPVVIPPAVVPPVVVPPPGVVPPVVTPPVVELPVVVPPILIPPVIEPPVVTPPVVVPPIVQPPVVTPPVVVPPVVLPPVVVPPVVTPPVITPPVVSLPVVNPPVVVAPPVVAPVLPAPLPEMCTIAPDSNLCQVLPPTTPTQPVQAQIQQAANFLITTTLASSSPVAPTTGEIAQSVAKGETAATAPVDATGQKNQLAKKNYCN